MWRPPVAPVQQSDHRGSAPRVVDEDEREPEFLDRLVERGRLLRGHES